MWEKWVQPFERSCQNLETISEEFKILWDFVSIILFFYNKIKNGNLELATTPCSSVPSK
jgi:hypothetical protein